VRTTLPMAERAGQKALKRARTMPREAQFHQILCAVVQGFSLHTPCAAALRIAKRWSNCAATSRARLWPTSAYKPTPRARSAPSLQSQHRGQVHRVLLAADGLVQHRSLDTTPGVLAQISGAQAGRINAIVEFSAAEPDGDSRSRRGQWAGMDSSAAGGADGTCRTLAANRPVPGSTAFMCVVLLPGSATACAASSRCSAVGAQPLGRPCQTQPAQRPFWGGR